MLARTGPVLLKRTLAVVLIGAAALRPLLSVAGACADGSPVPANHQVAQATASEHAGHPARGGHESPASDQGPDRAPPNHHAHWCCVAPTGGLSGPAAPELSVAPDASPRNEGFRAEAHRAPAASAPHRQPPATAPPLVALL